MMKAIDTYVFHPLMISRLAAGEFHPFIHLGYGIEFQLPMIVSEALAQAAVLEDTLSVVINEKYWAPYEGKNRSIT